MPILTVRLVTGLDSGRGGAELWSLQALDREEHRQMTAEVTVEDAGGLAATHPVTVVVDDTNDNPMSPGAKVVHLWKIQVRLSAVWIYFTNIYHFLFNLAVSPKSSLRVFQHLLFPNLPSSPLVFITL